jgi:hypothetical protein
MQLIAWVTYSSAKAWWWLRPRAWCRRRWRSPQTRTTGHCSGGFKEALCWLLCHVFQQRNGLARWLGAKGLVQEALEIATDQDYRSGGAGLWVVVIVVLLLTRRVRAAQQPSPFPGGQGAGAGGAGECHRPGLQVRGCKAMLLYQCC